MNIEFHYYLTKYLALEAGFEEDEAEIIAYSSQYVDDNYINFHININKTESYENITTQFKDLIKPKPQDLHRNLLFHYLPGDPTSPKVRRRDGKMHILITTVASSHAQELFFESTKNEDLFGLGIASHMLADTIAHQNFIGTQEIMNSMEPNSDEMERKIGHSDAGFKPDIPNLIWFDKRLISKYEEVNNKERIIFAANKLYSNFLFLTSYPSKWNTVKKTIISLIDTEINEMELDKIIPQQKARIKKYKNLLAEYDTETSYDAKSWLNSTVKEEVKFNLKTYSAKPKFVNSNWYKFQEAAKSYESLALSKLDQLFVDLDIENW
jgi:uncharacterized protein DUF6765